MDSLTTSIILARKDGRLTSQLLARWLRESCGCDQVIPCEVQIGTQRWTVACEFWKPMEMNSQLWRHHAIDVVGALPDCYRRHRTKVAFTRPGSAHEWYIGGWFENTAEDERRFQQFHPFGAHFNIDQWDDVQLIDAYYDEAHKYARVPLIVQTLGA